MNELANFDIPEYVKHISDENTIYVVDAIILSEKNNNKDPIRVYPPDFVKEYEEYISPDQIVIEALKEEIRALRTQLTSSEGTLRRKHLLPEERKAAKQDIMSGATMEQVMAEYGFSGSQFYKLRIEARKEKLLTIEPKEETK